MLTFDDERYLKDVLDDENRLRINKLSCEVERLTEVLEKAGLKEVDLILLRAVLYDFYVRRMEAILAGTEFILGGSDVQSRREKKQS